MYPISILEIEKVETASRVKSCWQKVKGSEKLPVRKWCLDVVEMGSVSAHFAGRRKTAHGANAATMPFKRVLRYLQGVFFSREYADNPLG
jgi:hypothetical protein